MADTRPCVMQVVLSLAPGGTERLVIELVTRLSDDFRMVVCCLDEAGAWSGELTSRGVPVVALHRRPGFHPWLGVRIAGVAAAHDASILHAHHYSPFVYGRIASLLRRNLALIYTEHGRLSDDPPTRRRRVANALLGRAPVPMFAVSEALKAHMVAEGFRAGRIGVIHNGVDAGAAPAPGQRCAARRALRVPVDAFLIGTAARLDPVKDLPTLIEAAAAARQSVPSLRVVVAGDGPERPSLDAQVRKADRGDLVEFLGYRPDVRTLLPALDVYVNSSISEGVSLTILEAMAASVPVVATRVGGTPEVVVDGVTGVLVPPRSPDATARALVDLARDAGRRARLGAAGRQRFEAAFTIERMTADYARQYARARGR